jgi:hypothetical protein
MNRKSESKKLEDEIRLRILKPFYFDLIAWVNHKQYPVCALCRRCTTEFKQLDLDEIHGRYPMARRGIRMRGSCDPDNHQLLSRLCHNEKTTRKFDFRNHQEKHFMKILSDMMVKHLNHMQMLHLLSIREAAIKATGEMRTRFTIPYLHEGHDA